MSNTERPSADFALRKNATISSVTPEEIVDSAAMSGAAQSNGVKGWGETRDFLSKVVAWPADKAGCVNLHYKMLNERIGGQDIVTGKPFQSMDQLISYAEWARTKPKFKDMWYCTSLQSEAGTTQAGKPKARRRHDKAVLLKAIWVDIDVEETDPKKYHTLEEAWDALSAFRLEVGLPDPSAVVRSGTGLHVYWISDRPLTPAEWAPYAHGLKTLLLKHGIKCDAGLTTDDVRLLRLPNTLNYKYNPPRPVELLPVPLVEYDFEETFADLAVVVPGFKPGLNPDAPSIGMAFAGKTPSAVFAHLDVKNDKASAGIERAPLPPLPVENILQGCAFLRDAVETGGAEYTQPMWNLTTLAATFMEDGHALAHRMGREHPGYSVESTDELWARKTREREERSLGWPQCKTIQANGCGACETCPLLQLGKSPLHLGLPEAKNISGHVSDQRTNPVAVLKMLADQSADIATLLNAMNEAFAVTKYGGQIVIASLVSRDISFMTVEVNLLRTDGHL